MGLNSLILNDIRAKARWCYGDTSRHALVKAAFTDGTAAMVLYRLMQWSHKHRLVPLELIFNKLNSALCHCVIGRGADFGEQFVLIHSNGVVINSCVRGGNRVYLEHQVTIGAERNESPVLGSDIFIGCGARVIGAIQVGDRVRIGANAVVINDVPSDHTAVGVPARVIKRDLAKEAA
jgi:serine O-acetyltransferase